MKDIFIKSCVITISNMVLGSLIAVATYFLIKESNFEILIDSSVGLSWKSIYANNFKFLLIYSIPYMGLIVYSLGFIYIYILIGSTISSQGVIYTISKLFHLPLEVFALSMPLLMYKNSKKEIMLRCYLFMALTLLVSALIESNL